MKAKGTGWRIVIKLKPGRYKLAVVAVDSSGNRQAKAATKRFRVKSAR